MDGGLSNMSKLFDISESLEKNLRNSLRISLVPTIFNVGGIFTPGYYGIATAYLLKSTVRLAGLGNASIPLMQEKISDKNAPGAEINKR